jgi:sugar diacid utilization regulator
MLAKAGDGLGQIADHWDYLIKNSILQSYQHKRRDASAGKLYQAQVPLPGSDLAVRYCVQPLACNGRTYGYLLLFPALRELNELDLCRIRQTGFFCVKELINKKNVEAIEKGYKDHFIYDLLYNNFDSAEIIIQRGRYWNWDFRKPHQLLIIAPDDYRSLADKIQLLEQLQLAVSSFLQTAFSQLIVSEQQEQIVAIIPQAGAENKSDKQQLLSLAKRLQEHVQEIIPGIGVSIGIGKFYSAAADLCRSYQEAKHALELGKFIQEKRHVTHFEDLGIIRLLAHMSLEQLDDYYKEYLTPVIDYDAKNGANLLETLHLYFQQNGDLPLIADKLYMHPNTLRHRLKKVEELLDVDLQKMESRLNLAVACKIARMRQANP